MLLRRRDVAGVPLFDLALGAVLVASAAVTVLSHPWSTRTAMALVASCASAGLVALRRRRPRVMAAGFAVGLLALAAIGQGGTTTWAFVALLIVSFSSAEQLPPWHAAFATVGLLGCGIVYDASLDRNGVVSSVVSPLVIIGLPAAAGALLHRSREQGATLAALAAELGEQRDLAREAAVLAERARVARELHDVIAHTVGVMVVQAGAAERLLAVDHPAHEPVHAIRQTGKEAMSELRRVVGLLRTAGDDLAEPQPGLDNLHSLIESARGSGPVEAEIDADVALPAGVALTVYRTVQEALTNARRHAPGAAVQIRMLADRDQLIVTVDDDGPGRVGAAPDASGYGLIGLAERAELYGGTFEAGLRRDQLGWRVRLELPFAEVRTFSALNVT